MASPKEQAPATPQLLTINDLRRLFQCGRTAAYARVHEPGFPAPLALSDSAHRWWQHEVLAWLETRRAKGLPSSRGTASPEPERIPPPPTPVALKRGGRAR